MNDKENNQEEEQKKNFDEDSMNDVILNKNPNQENLEEEIKSEETCDEKKEIEENEKIKKKNPQITVLGAAPPKLEMIEHEEEFEEVKEKTSHSNFETKTKIFGLRTTANREDQVMDFIVSNAKRKKIPILSVVRPHSMRGYIFIEAESKEDAEEAGFGIPYARGILPREIQYSEIEHMLEQVKKEINIQKNDIAEIISGPFKREKCKVTRIDKVKEEVVVELLEAAVPIPITVKIDAIKVIRRENEEDEK
ncbi:MAG: transcription elongation factor Spt5 [Candidatus Woesearchaeota archaeon]